MSPYQRRFIIVTQLDQNRQAAVESKLSELGGRTLISNLDGQVKLYVLPDMSTALDFKKALEDAGLVFEQGQEGNPLFISDDDLPPGAFITH